MPDPFRRRAGRPRDGRRPARRPRRLLATLTAPVALVVGLVAGQLAGPVAGAHGVLAAWTSHAQVSGPVSEARVGTSLVKAGNAGTLAADAKSWTVATLLVGATGYLDLVNDSSIPAKLSMTVQIDALVGASSAETCSVPWTTAGSCIGTRTALSMGPLIGTSAPVHTTATDIPAGGKVHLRIVIGGVYNSAKVTARDPVVRPAGDRTQS